MVAVKKALIFLFFVVALIVVIDTDSAMRLIWKMRYGQHLRWRDVDVVLSASEYFMPVSAGGDYLLIRDSESSALISLRLQNIDADEIRRLVKEDCELAGCPKVDERLSNIDHVKIVWFTYPTKPLDEPMLQQHLLVEGSNVWVQYIGPSDRYQNHKATLDKLARALAAKVRAAEGGLKNQLQHRVN